MRESAEQLTRIVVEAEPVLRRLQAETVTAPLLNGGWSAKQVLGHLIDSASNNHQRFVRAALAEKALEWPGYDQNGCVRVEAFQEASWSMLVDTWSSLNRLLAHVLAHLPAEKAAVECRIGGEGPAMTLVELSRSYLSHLEHHLEQLRVRA